jgi:hypothetical protein
MTIDVERWNKREIDAMTERDFDERWYEIEWLWADLIARIEELVDNPPPNHDGHRCDPNEPVREHRTRAGHGAVVEGADQERAGCMDEHDDHRARW